MNIIFFILTFQIFIIDNNKVSYDKFLLESVAFEGKKTKSNSKFIKRKYVHN